MPKRVKYDINQIILWLDLELSWREVNRRHGKSSGTIEKWLKKNNISILRHPGKHYWVTLNKSLVGIKNDHEKTR